MQNLNQKNQKNQRILKALFTKFVNESNKVKKSNLQSEIIAKFGIENFESQSKLIKPKAEIKEISAINESTDIQSTNDLLSALNAIGITDSIKAKGAKSIFKSIFNNKNDRSKCRNSFQNAISIYLLHVAHLKKDLADAKLIEIKAIAEKYYIAECEFKSKDQYCTNNMDDNKKHLIELFIFQVQD